MEQPPAGAALVRPPSHPQSQLGPSSSPPVSGGSGGGGGGGGGMDGPDSKRSAVSGDLPEDSLAEILARVPIRCLCRSKCVAKAWRDLIEDPFHRKKLPQTLQGFFFITKQEICELRIDYVSMLARPPPLFQIDPSLSFPTELPGYETLTFTDSCNGLLLFELQPESSPFDYVVWNPATKQRGECKESEEEGFGVEFEGEEYVSSVHAYSSETGQWVHRESVQNQDTYDLERWYDQGLRTCQRSWCALLNGMLHFKILDQHQIVAVDAQGVTRKIIPVPMMVAEIGSCYVAQSQGRLHYIKQAAYNQLSIWVLEDYDTQEWVLKHSVSFMELFGRMRRQCCEGHKNGFSMVGMHPDGNVVFIVQNWDLKLISYDMDHKLVSVIGTLEHDTMEVLSYVPCFLELPALTIKY